MAASIIFSHNPDEIEPVAQQGDAVPSARVLELVMAHGYADTARAVGVGSAPGLAMEARDFGGAIGVRMVGEVSPVSRIYNQVCGLGIAAPATEALLDEIMAWYTEKELGFHVRLSPAAAPADLPDWLEKRGITRQHPWSSVGAKLYRSTAEPPSIPTALRIEQIDRTRAATLADVLAEIPEYAPATTWRPLAERQVGRAGWRHYLAFDGDRAVAIGALFVDGEAGWLGGGATLPAYRGRGAQGALIARRIRDAAELGCGGWLRKRAMTQRNAPTPRTATCAARV